MSKGSAVIKTDPSICSKDQAFDRFIYDTGIVTFINNGYEVISDNPLASFISVCRFTEVIIKNVNFTMNLFSGIRSVLMKFENILRIELNNIQVDYQGSSGNLIEVIDTLVKDQARSGTVFMNGDHFILANSRFNYIVANRLFFIESKSSCLNIKFVNNTFMNIEVNRSLIWYSLIEPSPNCSIRRFYTNSNNYAFELTQTEFLLFNNSFYSNLASENMIHFNDIGRVNISKNFFSQNRNVSINIFESILEMIHINNGYAILNTLPVLNKLQNIIY